MTVVAFTPKIQPPKDRRYKVALVKGAHKRLYQILPAGHEQWQCWTRIDGKPYLALCTDDAVHLDRIAQGFQDDVAALKADGWVDPSMLAWGR